MNKIEQLLFYAEMGWPIFPLKPGGKTPITPHGLKDATTNVETITQWHAKTPDANWGLRTGAKDSDGPGIIVIDLDAGTNGFDSWKMLEDSHQELIETPTVLTGGGGKHIYFQQPDGLNITISASKLAPGIDIRGNNGYVIIPPSKTEKPYEWDIDYETPIEPLPAWLLDEILSTQRTPPVSESLPDTVAEGARHNTLIQLAGALRRCGLNAVEIEKTLVSVSEERFASGSHPTTDDEISQVATWATAKPQGFPMTDLGNAERFMFEQQDNLLWCPDLKMWLMWNGRRWVKNSDNAVERLAYTTVRNILVEAQNTDDRATRNKLIKWATSSESASRIHNMMKLAQAFATIQLDQLDADPMLLNCKNGVVNLATGNVIEHSPRYLMTKIVNAEYDPTSECSQWEQALNTWTNGNKETQLYLQKATGYWLTGLVDEHAVFFLYGIGRNGKTSFTEAILQLLGDYGQTSHIEAILSSYSHSNSNATPYVARLAGARFVVTTEIPQNRQINASLLKDLSGGDRLVARYLHANPFEFSATHKLILRGNYRPRVRDDSEGFWRRIHIVPFNIQIPKSEQIKNSVLMSTFASEAAGMLAWAIEGCLYWQNEPYLERAPEVATATEDYRSTEDDIQAFIDAECEVGPDLMEMKTNIYNRFTTWAHNEGEKYLEKRSKKWVTQQLVRRGFDHYGDGRKFLSGIKVRPMVITNA